MAYNTPTLSHFTPKSPLKRFSFLSLTPTPSSDRSFARLLDSDSDKEYLRTPTNKGHRRSPSLQSPTKNFLTSTIRPKNRFALPFTMPSWSTSSKSSLASSHSASSTYYYSAQPTPVPGKSKTTRRRYMPVPFFTAVDEYQLINGGSEKSAIRAILRERGLDMTVDEAIAYFENEDVNGVVHQPAFSHAGADEYAGLIPRRLSSDGDTSSDDNHSHSRTLNLSTLRRRGPPAPLQINSRSPYGFEDSFVPNSCSPSNVSFVSSAASTTLYSPSIVSGKGSRNGASMVKGMFHKLSGRK